VALAARCAAVKLPDGEERIISSTITMPEADWGGRDLDTALPRMTRKDSDGNDSVEPQQFELQLSREVAMKGLGTMPIRQIYNPGFHMPSLSAENRALDGLYALYEHNRYWPRWEKPEPSGGQWSHVTPLSDDNIDCVPLGSDS